MKHTAIHLLVALQTETLYECLEPEIEGCNNVLQHHSLLGTLVCRTKWSFNMTSLWLGCEPAGTTHGTPSVHVDGMTVLQEKEWEQTRNLVDDPMMKPERLARGKVLNKQSQRLLNGAEGNLLPGDVFWRK